MARIRVGNIAYGASEAEVLTLCIQHTGFLGTQVDVRMPRVDADGPHQGYALVVVEDSVIAARLCEQLDGALFAGRYLACKLAPIGED